MAQINLSVDVNMTVGLRLLLSMAGNIAEALDRIPDYDPRKAELREELSRQWEEVITQVEFGK